MLIRITANKKVYKFDNIKLLSTLYLIAYTLIGGNFLLTLAGNHRLYILVISVFFIIYLFIYFLALLSSSDPPASASTVAGTIGMKYCARLKPCLISEEEKHFVSGGNHTMSTEHAMPKLPRFCGGLRLKAKRTPSCFSSEATHVGSPVTYLE
jgi:hypothetical protein